MVFSDLFFLFVFLPLFMLLYMCAGIIDKRRTKDLNNPRFGLRNTILIIFSLLFYSWGEPVYVFLMIICVVINYIAGRIMCDTTGKRRKAALIAGLVSNLLILGSFKYLNFFAEILRSIGIPAGDPAISLPIGISFYIFQSISYLIDVYRNDSPAQKRYTDLLLYISMFPQLIAGPIVRYGTVAEEINNRQVELKDVADGVFRFVIGLGKKVILANQLGEIADQFLKGDGLNSLTTAGAWLGILAFALQIYFDFSGYSDMAIGIGRCLGFHFCENFDHPYISRNITEFWRRWHKSLGSFFRDYLYIPLGGNRRHQILNILIVWALTGLWHGASWNFVLWGLFFAVVLVFEKLVLLKWKTMPRVLQHIYTICVMLFSFSLFFFDDMLAYQKWATAAFAQSGALTDFTVESALFDNFWLWIAAVLFCLPVRKYVSDTHFRLLGHKAELALSIGTVAKITVACVIIFMSVTLLIGATNNAFLYTRF